MGATCNTNRARRIDATRRSRGRPYLGTPKIRPLTAAWSGACQPPRPEPNRIDGRMQTAVQGKLGGYVTLFHSERDASQGAPYVQLECGTGAHARGCRGRRCRPLERAGRARTALRSLPPAAAQPRAENVPGPGRVAGPRTDGHSGGRRARRSYSAASSGLPQSS